MAEVVKFADVDYSASVASYMDLMRIGAEGEGAGVFGEVADYFGFKSDEPDLNLFGRLKAVGDRYLRMIVHEEGDAIDDDFPGRVGEWVDRSGLHAETNRSLLRPVEAQGPYAAAILLGGTKEIINSRVLTLRDFIISTESRVDKLFLAGDYAANYAKGAEGFDAGDMAGPEYLEEVVERELINYGIEADIESSPAVKGVAGDLPYGAVDLARDTITSGGKLLLVSRAGNEVWREAVDFRNSAVYRVNPNFDKDGLNLDVVAEGREGRDTPDSEQSVIDTAVSDFRMLTDACFACAQLLNAVKEQRPVRPIPVMPPSSPATWLEGIISNN